MENHEMADQRTYTAGRFALDIDGFNVGFLKKFSGLAMEADIVANDLGPDNVQKKHVAEHQVDAGKATVGIGMGKGMYDWIKAVVRQGLHDRRTARSRRPTSTTRRSRSSTS